MTVGVARAIGCVIVLTMLATACSSAGGTGTVWWGPASVASGADLAPIPYGLAVADHDRAYAALNTNSDVALPPDDRFDYVRQLRLAKASPTTSTQGRVLLDALASRPPTEDTRLSTLVGYHDLLAPTGSLTPLDASAVFATREFVDRFGLATPVLTASPQGDARGVVILVHGAASFPGYLSGQAILPNGRPEYHRTPGPKWLAAGYEVVIPYMQGVTEDDFAELGFSYVGLEAARVIDLATTIRLETDLPIVLVGLSRGAVVAEIATVFHDDIAVTVSSGGSLRKVPADTNPIDNASVFQLLVDRDLVISLATNDVYQRWTLGEVAAHLVELEAEFAAAAGSLTVVKFVGFHEMWAPGDIAAVSELLDG